MDIKPGSPERRTRSTTGTRSRSAQTAAPVQLDQVLGTLQTNTRKDLQELLEGYGDALNGQPQPGEDDDQDPDVKGETGGQALNDSLEYSADALRGSRDRQPGHARHRAARPLEADRRPAEGLRARSRAARAAQGPDHELQHHHRRRSPPRRTNLGGDDPRAARGARGGAAGARQPERRLPVHARVGARDDPGRPRDAGHASRPASRGCARRARCCRRASCRASWTTSAGGGRLRRVRRRAGRAAAGARRVQPLPVRRRAAERRAR